MKELLYVIGSIVTILLGVIAFLGWIRKDHPNWIVGSIVIILLVTIILFLGWIRKYHPNWIRLRKWKNILGSIFSSLKHKVLNTPEIEKIITKVNFSHQKVSGSDIAKELNGLFKLGHWEFGDDYCCGRHFDIESFASVKKTNIREKIELELIDEYKTKSIKTLFYLKRGPWSGLLVNVGEHKSIHCEVIPIDGKKQLDPTLANQGDNILIVDLLTYDDGLLNKVVEYFKNVIKANIVDVICLFSVPVPDKNFPITKTLINLDLKVTLKEKCEYCPLKSIYRQDYYQ
jgi:ABC-type multidrug transport system fused ATPase/permease subunit